MTLRPIALAVQSALGATGWESHTFGVQHAPGIFTYEDSLSASECAALITLTEGLGYEAAPITTGAGFVMRPDIRNNTRVILDDPALAALIFERARHRIPESVRGMHAVGANERLRCYRYEPGQRFAPHYDGAFIRDDHEESCLTFMVYLNDG